MIQGLDSQNHYLAPEIFKSLKGTKKAIFNQYKADVFSLGISLIEASNLESLEKAYDWDKLTLDENLVRESLTKVSNKYSNDLADILAKMTLIDHNNRPDFLSLDTVLNPKRPEIRARLLKKIEVKLFKFHFELKLYQSGKTRIFRKREGCLREKSCTTS